MTAQTPTASWKRREQANIIPPWTPVATRMALAQAARDKETAAAIRRGASALDRASRGLWIKPAASAEANAEAERLRTLADRLDPEGAAA